MAADTVSLTYKADIADLRAKLASIPDITAAEARKAVGELDKAMKAAAKAQQQAAQAAKDSAKKMEEMAKATKDASFGSDELGRSAVKLRGILGTIDPRLGEMAGLVDDLVDGFEGLELMSGASASALSGVGVALGAAALAAAGAGTAYLAVTNHSQAMAEEAGHVASALEAARSRTEATSKAMAGLSIQMATFGKSGAALRQTIADINAGTSQLEILQRAAEQQVRDSSDALLKGAAERATALDIERQRQEALVASMAKTDAAYGDELARLQFLNKATKDAQRDAAFLNKERDEQISMARDVAEYNYLLAESEKQVGETTKASAKATREQVEALEDWSDLNAQIDADNLERSKQKEQDAAASMAAIDAEIEAEREKYAQITEAAAEYEQMVRDQVAEETRLRQQAAFAIAEGTIGAVDAIVEAQIDAAREGSKAQERLLKVQKGLAIAGIAIDTAKAVMGIWAAYAALPPVAGALSAAVIATGAVQAGIVASQDAPTFHSGGLQGTETMARVLPGEMVVDRSTTDALGGPAGLRSMVGGGGGTVIRIGRTEVREMLRTDLRSGGLLAQVGRKAASSSTPVGRSARRPLA